MQLSKYKNFDLFLADLIANPELQTQDLKDQAGITKLYTDHHIYFNRYMSAIKAISDDLPKDEIKKRLDAIPKDQPVTDEMIIAKLKEYYQSELLKLK